jgi:hypothetical protein
MALSDTAYGRLHNRVNDIVEGGVVRAVKGVSRRVKSINIDAVANAPVRIYRKRVPEPVRDAIGKPISWGSTAAVAGYTAGMFLAPPIAIPVALGAGAVTASTVFATETKLDQRLKSVAALPSRMIRRARGK